MDIQVYASHFPYEEPAAQGDTKQQQLSQHTNNLEFTCQCVLTANALVHKWFRVRQLWQHVMTELDTTRSGALYVTGDPDEEQAVETKSRPPSADIVPAGTERLVFPVELHDLVVSQVRATGDKRLATSDRLVV